MIGWSTTTAKQTQSAPIFYARGNSANTAHKNFRRAGSNPLAFKEYQDILKDTYKKTINSPNNRKKMNIVWATINTNTELVLERISKQDIVGVRETINNARLTLGLPNNDIAKVMNISRQSLYLYLKDDISQKINESTIQRAKEIYAALDIIKENNIEGLGSLARNYFFEEETLMSLLTKEEINLSAIANISSKLSHVVRNNNKHKNENNELNLLSLTKSI